MNSFCKEADQNEGYAPVRCEKCKFIICSSILETRWAADGSDYGDPICPICGSARLDYYDGPYIDQTEFLFNKLMEAIDKYEAMYWNREGELLDLYSKYKYLVFDKWTQPQPATESDHVAYLTLPHHRVLPWYGDCFWEYKEGEEGLKKANNITHWAALPDIPK